MKITTDMIAVGGLVIALVAGIVLSAPAELLTGIVGGLSGYISKTVQQGGDVKRCHLYNGTCSTEFLRLLLCLPVSATFTSSR